MTLLAALAAFATIFVSGLGVALLLGDRGRPPNLAVLAGHSWLLGCGVISLWLWIGGVAFRGAWLLAGGTLLAVGLGATGVSRGWRSPVKPCRPPFWIGVLIAQAIFIVWRTPQLALEWDGLVVWEAKARIAFAHGGVLLMAYLQDASRVWSHPKYPLFLPLSETWLYLWLGRADQTWVRALFPVFYGATAALLGGACARLTQNRSAAWMAAALLFFVPFFFANPAGVLSGYADVPLGACYLAAIAALLGGIGEGNAGELRIAAACSALLPWVKQEGVILWVAFAVAAAVVVRGRRLIMVLAPGAGIILVLKLHEHWGAVVSDASYAPLSMATLVENSSRLGPILARLCGELFAIERWSLTWIALLPALWWIARQGHPRTAGVLALATLPPMAAYALIYLCSTWSDYLQHLAVSLPRLLLQLAPVAVLSLALALSSAATESPRLRERD